MLFLPIGPIERFRNATPSVWNSLPLYITDNLDSLVGFKTALKTYYYSVYFWPHDCTSMPPIGQVWLDIRHVKFRVVILVLVIDPWCIWKYGSLLVMSQSLVEFRLLTSVCEAWQWSRLQNLRRAGKNFIWSRLWTKVQEILGRFRGPLLLSGVLARLSISCFVHKLFGTKSRSCRKTEQV